MSVDWYDMTREQQKTERDALSERFLSHLEYIAEDCAPDDRPGWHSELIGEIRRLRAVASKLNEYRLDQSYQCPWCGADDDRPMGEPHKADCPAFTPDGVVK